MFNKVKEAIDILLANLPLFSKIVLTVWLPGSIIIVLLRYYFFPTMAEADELQTIAMEIRVSNLIEVAFSPLYGGALIYALSRRKQGLTVNYRESMSYAGQRSLKLFATRLSTGLIIFLGFIALIIPGIILGLRFALVDMVVELDRINGSQARQLSARLTKGKRGKIFGATTITIVGLLIFNYLLAWAFSIPLMLFGIETNFLADVVYECTVSVVSAIMYIVLFLFYWESKSQIVDS